MQRELLHDYRLPLSMSDLETISDPAGNHIHIERLRAKNAERSGIHATVDIQSLLVLTDH